MTGLDMTIAVAAVVIGACAQGSFGFGLGLIAAPVLALTDERFVPGPLLIVALVLTVLVAAREWRLFYWHEVKWAVAGRVPGSVLGTLAVVVLPERWLIVLFAVLVLIGVLLSAAGWHLQLSPVTLSSAGVASGFMGSITSIGGPPMALLYQRHTGSELRAALSVFFLFGTALSVTLLAAAGEIRGDDVGRAGILVPAMLVGYVASRFVSQWLDRSYIRPAILAFSAAASLTLLIVELT